MYRLIVIIHHFLSFLQEIHEADKSSENVVKRPAMETGSCFFRPNIFASTFVIDLQVRLLTFLTFDEACLLQEEVTHSVCVSSTGLAKLMAFLDERVIESH